MARVDAIRNIDPALFDRGWSRVSGSWQGMSKGAQMVRAARGYSPAIFKAISKGGCHTGAQLRAQLSYLTTKSSHILDSRGTHDGKKTLSAAEIDRVVRRFENQWGERHAPKLGHTTHLLMAFPVGTEGNHVRDVAQTVCEKLFQGEGSHFDYIAAIHQDRAHPHAHIVLNRRSKDGEMFFLGKDHHFNYDAFREAMVEAARPHGIRLEATRRLDRGIVTRAAETEEFRKAQQDGRTPIETERTGADLKTALAHVAKSALTYRGLAAEASRSNFEDVAEALDRASTILDRGGYIQADGAIYMTDDESRFDTLITEFSQNVREIEAAIDQAPAAEKPVIERKLTEVLRSVAHLNPLGAQSAALLDAASRDGTYSSAAHRADHVAQLDADGLKARLSETLKDSGIDPDAVTARIKEGAGTAALEREWLAQDLRAIAREADLDLDDPVDREDALDRLEAVHVQLGDVLTDARVLRAVDAVDEAERAESDPDVFNAQERQDFQQLVAQFRRTDFNHPFSDDPGVRRAGAIEVEKAHAAFDDYAQRSPEHAELASMAWEQVTDSRMPPKFAVAEQDRKLHAGDMDLALRDPSEPLGPITEELRTLARYRSEMPDDEFGAAVQDEIDHLRALGASRAYISERSFEIEDGVRQEYAERRYLSEAAPTVMAFVRKADANDPISEAKQQSIARQIDERLSSDAIRALRSGEAHVLERFTEDPLRQLELAKTYLQGDEVTANSPAMERVLDALAEEKINVQRQRHEQSHGGKGITHG